jgi:hypothetical protein
MANIKISELPAASGGTATQEFEINDGGVSRKVTGAQILAYVEANHTHLLSQITDAGTAAASDTTDFEPAGNSIALSIALG